MPGALAAGSPRVPSTTGSALAIRTPRSSSPPVPVASKATNPENASTRSATLTTIPSRLTLSVSRSARTSQATHRPLADGVRGPVYMPARIRVPSALSRPRGRRPDVSPPRATR